MVANVNIEVDMPSAMHTISPFSLSCNQNCTSKCCEGGGLGEQWTRWIGRPRQIRESGRTNDLGRMRWLERTC